MVKAVIFDIDGTLLDSVDLHAGALTGRVLPGKRRAFVSGSE